MSDTQQESAPSRVWKVGALAELTGLTVRALHHCDHIGLLRPSHRSSSGHRLYMGEDGAGCTGSVCWGDSGSIASAMFLTIRSGSSLTPCNATLMTHAGASRWRPACNRGCRRWRLRLRNLMIRPPKNCSPLSRR
ncbi:MAG: MerR family DNA-binding transcriptional regulator [Mycolicibacterium sp.]|nr:MerR family DNA-binding transcriptional regulator [Mycolicibacterium sp.]